MEHRDRFISVINFIIEYGEKRGYAPNVRELGPSMGLKSAATIHKIVQMMKRAGYIDIDAGIARSIRVLPRGYELIS